MSASPKPCRCCHGSGKESEPVTIGRRLKALREGKGILSKDMAEKLGISAAYLCMLEAGKRPWHPLMIEKFEEECA